MSDALNLERLRKEAKALLKQCRAEDAAAIDRMQAHLPGLSTLDTQQFGSQIKLADIHHALAREHGYRNWAELKRHDAPLERFLAAIRSGTLKAAQRELGSFPDLAKESIHAACGIGDADAVRYHLERDPKLINTEHGGWPPLIYACASRFHQVNPRHAAGILDCVSLLLDRRTDPNTYTLADPSDPDSRIPASARANVSLNQQVSSLLLQRGASPLGAGPMPMGMRKALQTLAPRIPLDEALTRLHLADPDFREGMKRRFAPFIERFAQPSPTDSDKTEAPFFLTEPVFRKAAIEIAEFVLKHGINPNVATGPEGSTILHEFVQSRVSAITAETVEWLLLHGVDPNLPRDDGQTPFVLAVRLGNTAAAEVMRAHGADINSVGPLDELMGACRNHDENTAGEILRRHPGVLATMGPEGHELLVSAAAANRQADVRFMAQLGFDPGGIGENGATALHVAAWYGQAEMVQLLLELRAPVNIRDATFGTTPLAWAAQGSRGFSAADGDYCTIIEALLDAGADYAACVNRWGVGPEEISSAGVAALLQARGFSK